MIYTSINKTDSYIELSNGNDKLIMPTNSVIFVEDESNDISIKTVGSRKTIGLIPKSAM